VDDGGAARQCAVRAETLRVRAPSFRTLLMSASSGFSQGWISVVYWVHT